MFIVRWKVCWWVNGSIVHERTGETHSHSRAAAWVSAVANAGGCGLMEKFAAVMRPAMFSCHYHGPRIPTKQEMRSAQPGDELGQVVNVVHPLPLFEAAEAAEEGAET